MMRRMKTKFAGLFIFGSLSCLTTVQASVIYVDKDKSCPGSGTSNSPYCSIQAAFNVADPGDVIRIRDSATPYDERAVATRSGTASAPITIEPDVGHHPKLRYSGRNAQAGVIEIKDANYWRIRDLTFDGIGTQTSRSAVVLIAYTRDITGHQIIQNTFRNWGGTGENTKGAAAVLLSSRLNSSNPRVKNSLISDNTFADNAHQAIRLAGTLNITIEHNLIQNTKCGRASDGIRVGATGIKDSQGSVGNIIRNNIIHDHQRSETCLLLKQGGAKYAGIYCDTGSTRGQVIGNDVYNIDKGHSENTNPRATSVSSVGIQIESRCHNWRVHDNLIYSIGIHGLRNGSDSTGDPNGTIWTNNTVYDIHRAALYIARGRNITVRNNILVHDQSNASIQLTKTAVSQGPHSIDHNHYWDMDNGTKVGKWGDYRTLNLANWRQACKCDSAASVSAGF